MKNIGSLELVDKDIVIEMKNRTAVVIPGPNGQFAPQVLGRYAGKCFRASDDTVSIRQQDGAVVHSDADDISNICEISSITPAKKGPPRLVS